MDRRTLKVAGAITVAILTTTACGITSDSKSDSPPTAISTRPSATNYGSVIELRDAAVKAGYLCTDWLAKNDVLLAAESATCDDFSVLSTYASKADLQSQLDREKANNELSTDVGLETTPILVGENWLFKAPEAAKLRGELGGVLIGAKQ